MTLKRSLYFSSVHFISHANSISQGALYLSISFDGITMQLSVPPKMS
jgi:hypothetical protein